MAKKSNSNNNGQSSKDKPKPKPVAKSTPVNVVSPGKDGRTWRGDTADFSRDIPDIKTFSPEE